MNVKILTFSYKIQLIPDGLYSYDDENKDEIYIVPTLKDTIKENSAWCGTFQLIWNDMKNEVAKRDVVFTPQEVMADNLNKETFNEENIRVVGDLDKSIKKVAILGGSGGSFAVAAKKLGCDCIITGEVKQNNAIDALEYNMSIIEVSHSVEAFFKEYVKTILENNFTDIEFILSKKDVNPFKCL